MKPFVALFAILVSCVISQRIPKCKHNSDCTNKDVSCMNRETRNGDPNGWCLENNHGTRQCITPDDCIGEPGQETWTCSIESYSQSGKVKLSKCIPLPASNATLPKPSS